MLVWFPMFRPHQERGALPRIGTVPWCSGSTGVSKTPGPGSIRWWDDQQYKNIKQMTINFKKLSDKAVQPVRTTTSGAGYNLTVAAITTEINERGQLVIVYHTNLGVEVPDGYEGVIRPLATIAAKTLRMCDAPGVITGNIDDEIVVRFVSTTDVIPAVYKEGEQFAQLVFNKIEDVEFVEIVEPVDEDSAATEPQSPSESEGMPINSEPAPEPAAGENAPEQA